MSFGPTFIERGKPTMVWASRYRPTGGGMLRLMRCDAKVLVCITREDDYERKTTADVLGETFTVQLTKEDTAKGDCVVVCFQIPQYPTYIDCNILSSEIYNAKVNAVR